MKTTLRQIIEKKVNGIRGALLAFLTFVICLSASAQIQQAWVAKYNNGITNGNHQALKMTLDSSGNIYVLGVSQNANTNTGYVTIKYAPNGNALWTARYDSTNFPSATPTGFALDTNNNVIVTGTAVTVKYDSNGNQLWNAPYDAQAVAVDTGQNTYITGVSSNFTTMELNSMGSNVWSVTDPSSYSGPINLAQAIVIDAATNLYVCGSEFNFQEQQNALGLPTLIKYSPNGQLVWKATVTGGAQGTSVKIEGFVIDNAVNLYVTANVYNFDAKYQTFKFYGTGASGWYAQDPTANGGSASAGLVIDTMGNVIVTGENAHYPPLPSYGTYKIDTNGNYLWTNLYPMSSYGASGALALAVDSANSVYVTGASTITNTGSDIATLKYGPNGNQIWLQRYDGPGHTNDAGDAIAVDNTGNVYVAGYETETNGFTEMVLIKYSLVTVQRQSNGNFILQAYGSPGENFDIQASTNLQTWQDLGHVIADTNGFAQFADTNASNFNARFYYTVPQ